MIDTLTLGQLRTFVAIADAGGFRAGAVRLRRAQSAVSHAVASLEAELGITLFDRSGRRPVLTQAGTALLEDARAVLLKVDTMRARAQGVGMGLELELTLAVDTLFPLPIIGQALLAVQRRYPSVRMQLQVAPLGGPLVALLEGQCAMAVTVGNDLHDPRLIKAALGSVAVVPVVAASHALASRIRPRVRLRPEDITEHPQIVLSDPTPMSAGRDFNVLSPQTCRVGTQDAKRALIVRCAIEKRDKGCSLESGVVRRDRPDRLAIKPAHKIKEVAGPRRPWPVAALAALLAGAPVVAIAP